MNCLQSIKEKFNNTSSVNIKGIFGQYKIKNIKIKTCYGLNDSYLVVFEKQLQTNFYDVFKN